MDMTMYNAAIYLRLSKDDGEEGKRESNSITNQRNLLRAYAKDRLDLKIVDEYIDDGYSGATFVRPSFIKMMEDVNSGKINCIIVKDLSRFGRDYIESGKYIQKIFPAKNIRFIAVNDNYDSITADTAESHLVLPVKNFINDSYCRDISTKVKSSQQIKRKKGEFIGAFATYGYKKHPEKKNSLIIDERAAQVVKLIFNSKLEGYSNQGIATKLNELGYLSPLSYKQDNGSNFISGFSNGIDSKWNAKNVGRILKNKVYIGILEQGKRVKINYKIDKRIKANEFDWIVVEDAHEPIISKDVFERVQDMCNRDLYLDEKSDNPHLFSGMLYCKDCGSSLIRRVNKYKGKETVFYICSTYNKKKECTRHSIKQEDLEKVLVGTFNYYFVYTTNLYEKIVELRLQQVKEEDFASHDEKLIRLESSAKKYRALKSALYDDLKEGIIDENEFARFRTIYTIKTQDAEIAIKKQEELLTKVLENIRDAESYLRELETFKEIKKVTRNILISVVDKILVSEDKALEIVFHEQEEHAYLEEILASYNEKVLKEAI